MQTSKKAEAELAAIDAEHSARLAEAARADTFSVEPAQSADAGVAVSRAPRTRNLQFGVIPCIA